MREQKNYNLALHGVAEGHMVVGFVMCCKVIDENGQVYFMNRTTGLNDMECLGMAQSILDDYMHDVRSSKHVPEFDQDEGDDDGPA